MKPVYLVSCVSTKAAKIARAADLYQSDWFRKARAYVEATGCRWFILSAEHGLLRPGTRVAPYDTTLAAIGASGRREWGARVSAELADAIGPRTPVIIMAGKLYRESLAEWAGKRATVPMEGLGIGEQKAWLAARLSELRDRAARAAQLELFPELT